MREIKFRVWTEWNKKMMSPEELMESKCMPIGMLMTKSNFIFLQFTGLKDKNGKEIYEGDIIKYIRRWQDSFGEKGEEEIALIEVETYGLRLYLRQDKIWKAGLKNILHIDGVTKCEVVGNIYENPELIK